MVGASAASDALQAGNQGVGAMSPAAGRYGRSDAGSLPLRITILRARAAENSVGKPAGCYCSVARANRHAARRGRCRGMRGQAAKRF